MKRLLCMLALLPMLASAFADTGDPPASLYHFKAALNDQQGAARGLDMYRGHPVLVTMFYASCPASCPLIIDTLRATDRAISDDERSRLRILMISIDAERDTPAALNELAKTRRLDTTRWTLAHADEATVRKIAALLNVQYRKLPNGEFNHSNVLTVLSPKGEVLASSSELGHADPRIVEALRR